MGQHQIDFGEARERLAQRPGGQQQAVAQRGRVHHGDLQVSCEMVVLHAVVGDEHVALGMQAQQRARSGGTVLPHHQRASGKTGEQHRLVAIAAGVAVCGHKGEPALRTRRTAMAAADDAGVVASDTQHPGQPVDHRRLATAADRDVADHDHRHRQALRLRERAAAAGEETEQQGERTQGLREQAATLPERWGLRSHVQSPGRRGPEDLTAPTTGWRR